MTQTVLFFLESLSALLHLLLFQTVPSHLFLRLLAREEMSVSEMLLFFFTALWCSSFSFLFLFQRMLRYAVHTWLFLYLCAAPRHTGIDRAQWWTGRVSPAANQKVNSLSIEEGGQWPPGLQPHFLPHSHTHTHTHIIHTHTYTHTHMHTRIHAHFHAHTHTHAHTHSNTHSRTHAHTHTTYTQCNSNLIPFDFGLHAFWKSSASCRFSH